MTEFIQHFFVFIAGFAIGWIASRLAVVWRDIQRSRVDRIRYAAGEGKVKELKVRR